MNINARSPWFSALLMALIVTMLSTATGPAHGQSVAREPQPPEALPAAEFARLIRELSEEGGFFPSDNFTSNESSYLTVLDKLRGLGATGGAVPAQREAPGRKVDARGAHGGVPAERLFDACDTAAAMDALHHRLQRHDAVGLAARVECGFGGVARR